MVDADAQPLGGIGGGRPHSEQAGNLLDIHGVAVADRETVEIDPPVRRRPSHRLVSAAVVIEEPSGVADQLLDFGRDQTQGKVVVARHPGQLDRCDRLRSSLHEASGDRLPDPEPSVSEPAIASGGRSCCGTDPVPGHLVEMFDGPCQAQSALVVDWAPVLLQGVA
jgi:hypothetical protein